MNEWFPVLMPPLTGYYEITRDGRVRRVGPRGRGASIGYELKPSLTGEYLAIVATIRARGFRKSVYIHDMVAWTFIGPKPDGWTVNHKNLDKMDNRVENLEYATQSENVRHRVRHLGGRKLTAADVREIRRLYRNGPTNREIARRFGVNANTVWHIGSGRTWAHLRDDDAAQEAA